MFALYSKSKEFTLRRPLRIALLKATAISTLPVWSA